MPESLRDLMKRRAAQEYSEYSSRPPFLEAIDANGPLIDALEELVSASQQLASHPAACNQLSLATVQIVQEALVRVRELMRDA